MVTVPQRVQSFLSNAAIIPEDQVHKYTWYFLLTIDTHEYAYSLLFLVFPSSAAAAQVYESHEREKIIKCKINYLLAFLKIIKKKINIYHLLSQDFSRF